MDVLSELLRLLTAPPLPQVLLSSAAIIGVSYALMRIFRLNNPRVRSAFFSLALITPLVFYIFFTPQIWFTRHFVSHGFPIYPGATPFEIGKVIEVNYTGVICVVGAIIGAATLFVSVFFSVPLVKRLQGVVEVTCDEEPGLCGMVERVAEKMGVDPPRIGLTDHLQPNAFTVGRGGRAMVVFTMGLIDALSPKELEAVAAHEIAHIKNGDFSFMAILTSLKLAFFYNPISYLALSMVSREMEYLADEVGSRAISRTRQLRSALLKISKEKQAMEGNALSGLLTGLFVYSQIGSLKAAFTAHPKLDTRLRYIGKKSNSKGDAVKTIVVAVLLLGTLFFASGYIFQPMRIVNQFIFRFDPAFGANMIRFDRGSPLGGMVFGIARTPPIGTIMSFRVAPIPPP